MDIFQRSIHSNVKQADRDRILVTSSLLDLEHSLHLELVVRTGDRTIESAKAAMSKTPLTRCSKGVERIPGLAGTVIDRGVLREIHRRVGGPRGCAHLVELLDNAVRLISMILIGSSLNYWSELKERMTEEQIVAEGRARLRNTCLVFADEGGGERPAAAACGNNHGQEAEMVTRKDVKKVANKVVKAEKKVVKKVVKAEKAAVKTVARKAASAGKTVVKKAAAAKKTVVRKAASAKKTVAKKAAKATKAIKNKISW